MISCNSKDSMCALLFCEEIVNYDKKIVCEVILPAKLKYCTMSLWHVWQLVSDPLRLAHQYDWPVYYRIYSTQGCMHVVYETCPSSKFFSTWVAQCAGDTEHQREGMVGLCTPAGNCVVLFQCTVNFSTACRQSKIFTVPLIWLLGFHNYMPVFSILCAISVFASSFV